MWRCVGVTSDHRGTCASTADRDPHACLCIGALGQQRCRVERVRVRCPRSSRTWHRRRRGRAQSPAHSSSPRRTAPTARVRSASRRVRRNRGTPPTTRWPGARSVPGRVLCSVTASVEGDGQPGRPSLHIDTPSHRNGHAPTTAAAAGVAVGAAPASPVVVAVPSSALAGISSASSSAPRSRCSAVSSAASVCTVFSYTMISLAESSIVCTATATSCGRLCVRGGCVQHQHHARPYSTALVTTVQRPEHAPRLQLSGGFADRHGNGRRIGSLLRCRRRRWRRLRRYRCRSQQRREQCINVTQPGLCHAGARVGMSVRAERRTIEHARAVRRAHERGTHGPAPSSARPAASTRPPAPLQHRCRCRWWCRRRWCWRCCRRPGAAPVHA